PLKPLPTRAQRALAHARPASPRPGSWTTSRRVARAGDRPAVSPVRSASARSSTSPACDTTPVPPPVTSSPFSQPVPFTSKVLLVLDRKGRQTPLSSQFRSTFISRRAGPAHHRHEFSGLGSVRLGSKPVKTFCRNCHSQDHGGAESNGASGRSRLPGLRGEISVTLRNVDRVPGSPAGRPQASA